MSHDSSPSLAVSGPLWFRGLVRVLLVAAAVILLATQATLAHTCSCAARPAAEIAAENDADVRGVIERVKGGNEGAYNEGAYTVRLTHRWKGSTDDRITVVDQYGKQGNSCAMNYAVSTDLVWMLKRDGESWRTALCSSHPADEAWVGEVTVEPLPKLPQETGASRVPALVWFGGGALAVLALVGIVRLIKWRRP